MMRGATTMNDHAEDAVDAVYELRPVRGADEVKLA